ncbi:MAG: 16S rRNA (guanine(527)-N(7))-methyltransferase RsmG [Clostridia bacterium]|nr:16S rRNA (guanine(527)-N(7))-methyltransferase RsmG [Clostridia bacterium]
MEREDFLLFCEELRAVFLKNDLGELLTPAACEQFYRLTAHMLEENEHYNLTAIKDRAGIILRHYADSLLCARYLAPGTRLLDVGCGAGFPTLPLAICRPDLQITALDATEKRVRYVAGCAELLGLSNVETVCARAEEYAKGQARESFDCVTARAVAELRTLAELCIPCVRNGGLFLAMKAKNAEEELAAAAPGIGTLGCRLTKKENVTLYGGEETLSRTALLFTKIKNTPENYPRPYARMLKKPL